MGILIASVVLEMHLLTQNGCHWCFKNSCMEILVNSDKTHHCPGDLFCQNPNPYYFLWSVRIFFALQSVHVFSFMAIHVA